MTKTEQKSLEELGMTPEALAERTRKMEQVGKGSV